MASMFYWTKQPGAGILVGVHRLCGPGRGLGGIGRERRDNHSKRDRHDDKQCLRTSLIFSMIPVSC